jgi:riboflavin biosynthesis pyrimidine reductase
MRALLPTDATGSNVDVHGFFGRDWLEVGGLRVNFIASADGAIAVAGRSRGLQTPGDNRIFAALRDLADVVLVGAGTARSENYRAAHPKGDRLKRRLDAGLAPTLPIAVVSRSLGLDPGTELFTGTHADARTIVFTCAAAKPERHPQLNEMAEVIVCGDEEVDLSLVHGTLNGRGLNRVLCEGGPTLFADLSHGGNVSELCVSIAPILAGPGSPRITAGPEWPEGPRELQLHSVLEEDGALFVRYRVGESS